MDTEKHLPQPPHVALNPSATVGPEEGVERCPWCDSTIARGRFLQIRAKIAEQERKRFAEEKLRIEQESRSEKEEFQARLEKEAAGKLAAMAAERDQAATQLRELEEWEAALRRRAVAEAEERVRAEAAEKLAAVSAERDQAATQLRELEEREAALRQRAIAEAEERVRAEAAEKLAAVSTERDQAATQLRELEEREAALRQRAIAETEERVRAEAAEKLAAISTQRDQVATQLEEAKVQYQKDISQVRSVLEQDRDSRLAELASQRDAEREQLREQVNTLTKQLEQRNASELGEGVDVDICEVLKNNFESDDISRIQKGKPGANIIHRVLHKGRECGSIIFDSKNRQAWRDSYLERLREDQIAAKADHAILTTRFFPQGRKELYIDQATGIIVVNHARIIEIVNIVRLFMIQLHRQDLTLEQRAEKKEKLYEYLTSEDYRQEIAEASRLSDEMAELDVEEVKAHQNVWQRRGHLQRKLSKVIRHIEAEVSAVLDGKRDS